MNISIDNRYCRWKTDFISEAEWSLVVPRSKFVEDWPDNVVAGYERQPVITGHWPQG